jgi:hypothetical protein
MSYQNVRTNADATAPIGKGVAVTKSDTTRFEITRGLWVGVGGSVVVIEADGTTQTTYAGVPNGYLLPVQCVGVAAATSASSIVRVY